MWQCTFVLLLVTQFVQSANILGFFLFPSISHQIVYRPIWKELSLRGHQVTVVTPDPLNDPSLVNLTEIDVHSTYDILKVNRIDQLMSKDLNLFQYVKNIYLLMDVILEEELNHPQFQKVLKNENQHFDLILIECFHPVVWGLAARYKAPIIGVSSLGATIVGHDAVGNPTHPVLNPDILMNVDKAELTLSQKIKSVIHNIWYRLYYNYVILPRADVKAREYFGEDIPYVGDLEKNVSLLFLNVNPFLHGIRPNVPAIIEMGQMHINPVKPLPVDLKKYLDKAKEGVVYFSLGSNMKSVNMPTELRENIIAALSELPYKVLWKWESDHLPGKPNNVMTRKWLPQQDILAHPNVKAFVTQGGLQSSEEAISRGVPLVGMPFLGDQPLNVQKLVELGVAVGLDYTKLTKDQLKEAILTVAQDEKYKDNMKSLRNLLFDQPMTGLEKAVWWSEYVIRHKGAAHLRSPTLTTSWFDYYLIDVFIVLVVVPLISFVVLYKIIAVKVCTKKKLKSN